MKKYKYKIIFILNILIMAFLIGMSLFNELGVKASSNDINISFEDTTGGDEYFTYVNDNGETITLTGGKILSNTAITLYANSDDEYRFVHWIYKVNETTMVLSEKNIVSVTVKKDYKFIAVYAKSDECVVTYFDNTPQIYLFTGLNKVDYAYTFMTIKDGSLQKIGETVETTTGGYTISGGKSDGFALSRKLFAQDLFAVFRPSKLYSLDTSGDIVNPDNPDLGDKIELLIVILVISLGGIIYSITRKPKFTIDLYDMCLYISFFFTVKI